MIPRRRRKSSAARPKTAVPAPLPASQVRLIQCLCGRGIEVLPEHHGWKRTCGTCHRAFEVHMTPDPSTGALVASLTFSSENSSTGTDLTLTSTDGGSSASMTSVPSGEKSQIGLAIEPEQPGEVHFRCGCGTLLAARKEHFDKRVSCPGCGARKLITLIYDHGRKTFTLQSLTLMDKKSGKTRVIPRLA